jgi:DNA-binding transcriptional ArsR family regulator
MLRHNFPLSVKVVLKLRHACMAHPDKLVRKRAAWILALGQECPVSRLARAVGVSRPTIYRYARAWLALRDVRALETETAARFDRERLAVTRSGAARPPPPSTGP